MTAFTNNNNEPLHKRVHWRHFRSMTHTYSRLEDVDESKYDFSHICCYSCAGIELCGSNVTYTNIPGNYGPIVWDNHYDVFEVPEKSNYAIYHTNFVGNYLVFFYDKDFDYWVVGDMKYTVDPERTKSYSLLSDEVKYEIYGKYDVTINGNENRITKTEIGRECKFGGNTTSRTGKFDRMGNRRVAYGQSARNYIDNAKGIKHNSKDISDNKSIQIYKKKKSK